MKKLGFVTVVLSALAATSFAAPDPAEIKLRDVDFSGQMVIKADLTLTITFDVKESDVLDEVVFDFYLLVTPRDKDHGDQFFHCRTVHRYLEKESGYKSGISLNRNIVKCLQPRETKYAVVVTYGGKEAAVENSEKERWWEESSLGQPIENVLGRFANVPTVREWETVK